MSRISNVAAGTNPFENRILNRISYATSSGQLSQTDGTAISSALGDIAGQLQTSSGASSASSASSTSPGQFRKKINALIDGEVTSGKLTDAQASELKGLLEPGKGGPGGGKGPGGPGGASGSGHHHHHVKSGSNGTNQADDGDNDDQSSTTASNGSSASALQSAASSQSTDTSSDPIQAFLKMLGDAQNALKSATYGQQATTNSASTSSIGLVNQTI